MYQLLVAASSITLLPSRPFRLRMHLRLCSVPVGATTENNSGDTPDSLRDVDRVMEDHAHHWPKKGKLVVQVNPEFDRSKTWLPYTLVSTLYPIRHCLRASRCRADPV